MADTKLINNQTDFLFNEITKSSDSSYYISNNSIFYNFYLGYLHEMKNTTMIPGIITGNFDNYDYPISLPITSFYDISGTNIHIREYENPDTNVVNYYKYERLKMQPVSNSPIYNNNGKYVYQFYALNDNSINVLNNIIPPLFNKKMEMNHSGNYLNEDGSESGIFKSPYNIKIEIIEENQNNDGDIIISKIIDGINNTGTQVEGSFFDVKNGVYYLYDIKNIFNKIINDDCKLVITFFQFVMPR